MSDAVPRRMSHEELARCRDCVGCARDAGIYTCTADGVVTSLDSVAARVLGIEADAATDSSVADAVALFGEEEAALLAQVLSEGEQRALVSRIWIPSGAERLVVRDLVPDAEGAPASIVVSVRRVRERHSEAWQTAEVSRRLVENAREMVVVIDLPGRVTYVNKAAAQGIGYAVEELIGKPVIETIAPEYHADIRRRLRQRQTADATPSSYHSVLLRKDGSKLPVDVDSSPLISGGRAIGIFVRMRDVSEHQRIVNALRESEEKYRTLVDISPAGVFLETTDGEILDCNASACRLMGYTKEELIGLNATDIVPAEIAEKLAGMSAEELADGDTVISSASRRKDGSVFPTEVTVRLVTIGSARRALVYMHDLTRHAEAERALRESEEKYRLVVENANEAIVVVQDGLLHFANQSALDLTGFSKEEWLSTDYLQCIHSADQPAVEEFHARLLSGEEPGARIAVRTVAADGREKWVELGGVRVTWNGAPAALCFLTDITDRRQLEGQLVQSQKMEAIGRLAGGIAHDFNNLLTIINGYTRLMRQQLVAESAFRGHVDEIAKAAASAAELTARLLAFSRKGVVNPVVLDVNGALTNVRQLLDRIIGEDIELSIAFDKALPNVTADPGQIEQIVMNLVTNARDAMPDGGVISVSTSLVRVRDRYAPELPPEPGDYVVIAVSDTGHGMDERTRELIFEPFFTTKKESGTGLGLATVYSIVRQHGGAIRCQSAPGEGTTFRVYLPAVALPADHVPDGLVENDVRGGDETVLLAEDDESILALTAHALREKGYTVLPARTAEEALVLDEEHEGPIQLLLTDVVMPGQNGKQLADAVTARRPGISVIFTSGYTDNVVVRRGVKESGSAFLRKPYDLPVLLRKVREVLDHRAKADA